MLFSVVPAAIVLAASQAVNALPADLDAQGAVTRMSATGINGRQIDLAAQYKSKRSDGAGPCVDSDDVLSCAKKMKGTFKVDAEATFPTRKIRLPARYYGPERNIRGLLGEIELEYSVALSSCALADPVVVHKEPVKTCKEDTCEETVKFVTTVTDTVAMGYRFAGYLNGHMTLNTPPEVKFTSENGQGWSSSTTTTHEVTRNMTIYQDQTCAAATVQMQVVCQAVVNAPKDVNFIGKEFPEGRFKVIPDFCGPKDHIFSSQITPEVKSVCDAMSKHPVSMDFQITPFKSPWVMGGCLNS
ncbi:hypothetical protein UVI_02029870 [Ustilaginoidea virens]|uniref:Uncharacterized protein n=1 Tax=Ustilaginoidea virens TaxID=1159556 RepID=A0A1B5L5M1_USTVR|nr:hypothetical protein UVI_02029870 [Ustilaginoidea virens]